MASLMMEWNEVLDLFALGKAVIMRTELCKDQMSRYEAAVELKESESKLVSLLEANYTLDTKANLNPHYRGLIELRDRIVIDTERDRDRQRLGSAAPPPSAPKNRHSTSRKNRLARYNSRKMSMFHAAKFASVHDEFRRVVVTRSSENLLSSKQNIKLTVRILGVSMSSSSSFSKKSLCVLFTHHDREFRTLSKTVASSKNVVHWNQDFTFKIEETDLESIPFVMVVEGSDDWIWKGVLNLKNLISEDDENEGKFLERTVKLNLTGGGHKKADSVPLKLCLKWKRRVKSQYL